MLWDETITVTPTAGVFDVILGLSNPLSSADFASGAVWLELEVGTQVLTPRQELSSVPWALHAEVADALDDPAPASYQVPLGGIIDWYAFSPTDPVPDGYAICDGSTVTEPSSPFLGQTLPDLVDRFAMGVSSVGATGTTGGSNTANLSHTHSGPSHSHSLPSHSHTGPSHTHSGPSHTHTLANHSHGGLNHRHRWVRFVQANLRFDTFNSGASDTELSANETMAGNDLGEEGSGTTTVAKSTGQSSEYFYTSGAMTGTTGRSDNTDGSGTLTTSSSGTGSTGAAGTGNTGSWSGTSGSAGTGNTGSAGTSSFDNRPAWVGLLKIMRVR